MTQPATISRPRSRVFTWAAGAAVVLSGALATYFLIGYTVSRQFRPAIPTTVFRAAHYAGFWPVVRLAWVLAVLLGLALLVGALANGSGTPRGRRPLLAAVAFVALAAVVAALLTSPARPTFSLTVDPFAMQSTGGYARGGLFAVVAAMLYAGLALVSRRA